MATVKGTYTFRDTLTTLPCDKENPEFVNFTSNGRIYLGIFCDSGNISVGYSIGYISNAEDLGDAHCAYNYDAFPEDEVEFGWTNASYKTIDFGIDEQTVSDEFYAWLIVNAGNTQIDITKNGTTTLATAGKYCDRNINVNVAVPSNEEDSERYRKVIDRSIVEFVDNDITTIGSYSFRGCGNLVRVDSSSINLIAGAAFQGCNELTAVILRSATIVRLGNANAFTSTTVESGTGFIYVPDELVDDYKEETNWSTYANQIKSISELGE